MSALQIEYLTNDPESRDLCSLYWETNADKTFVHAVSDIALKVGISSNGVQRTAKIGCLAKSADNFCKNCNAAYIYTSRSDFQQRTRWNNTDFVCAKCVAEDEQRKKEENLAERQTQQRVIQEKFALKPHGPLDIDDLSLDDAVYLLSFARLSASEDLIQYGPLAKANGTLSPDEKYDVEILMHLFYHGLIVIHPSTSIDAFIFEGSEPSRMLTLQVVWGLFTGSDLEETRRSITILENIFRSDEWPIPWHGQWLPLWKKIALHECLEYLDVVLQDHSLRFNPGEKTLLVVTNLLETYSVGQIYNFIWRAGKDAAAFYMRGGVSKQQAANSVVGSIQRQAERAQAEGWDITPYRRDRRCPQSMVSTLLFDTVLKIGDEGFSLPPIANIPHEDKPDC